MTFKHAKKHFFCKMRKHWNDFDRFAMVVTDTSIHTIVMPVEKKVTNGMKEFTALFVNDVVNVFLVDDHELFSRIFFLRCPAAFGKS